MDLALSMWSVHKYWFDGKWDIEDFLDFAAETNVTGVELLSIFWRDQQKELPLVTEVLKRHNLKVACYSASNNFVFADPDKRAEQLKEITDSIDMAVFFNAPFVRVFSGDPGDSGISFEEGLDYIIEGLRKAAAYAEEKDVTLCLENHGVFAGKSGQVLEIIDKVGSPALRSTFDTGNFLLVDQKPVEAIKELADFVKHVHVKDFLRTDTFEKGALSSLSGDYFLGKIPGDGEVDLRSILSELKNSDYEGWITVEFEGSEEPKEGSARSIQYVDRLMCSIE